MANREGIRLFPDNTGGGGGKLYLGNQIDPV